MNLQNLQYFLAVEKEKSITKAAESLGITQQALSSQISRLEQEYGCTFFDRRHGYNLTQSGKRFYDSARQILNIDSETVRIINDINKNRLGELKIGISFSRGQAILPLILPEFHEKYPNIQLEVLEGSTHKLEEDLAKGTIDLLIGYAPFMLETVVTEELIRERIYLAVPDNRKFSPLINEYREKNDLSLFSGCPFILLKGNDRIRTLVNAEFHRYRVTPNVVLETENIQTAFSLASAGMGITVCPELYLNSPYTIAGEPDSTVRNHVTILPFPGNRYSDTVAIGYSYERYLSTAAKDFIKITIKKLRQ
ncbi:MAG: LysR family transcriptional regulator [Lachnospiraceae bacterium]|nr:LysR family transcriptional regulator [Lachnospiraceae bacterium]